MPVIEGLRWVQSPIFPPDLNYTATLPSCRVRRLHHQKTWFSTVHGRIGYDGWTGWMPYITGGVAFGTESDTSTGCTVGAGVEFAFLGNCRSRHGDLHRRDLRAARRRNCRLHCQPRARRSELPLLALASVQHHDTGSRQPAQDFFASACGLCQCWPSSCGNPATTQAVDAGLVPLI